MAGIANDNLPVLSHILRTNFENLSLKELNLAFCIRRDSVNWVQYAETTMAIWI